MESASQDEIYSGALATLFTLDRDLSKQVEAYLESVSRS